MNSSFLLCREMEQMGMQGQLNILTHSMALGQGEIQLWLRHCRTTAGPAPCNLYQQHPQAYPGRSRNHRIMEWSVLEETFKSHLVQCSAVGRHLQLQQAAQSPRQRDLEMGHPLPAGAPWARLSSPSALSLWSEPPLQSPLRGCRP